MSLKTAKPINDLELYELIVAAYPDHFDESTNEDIWDNVMEFAEDKFGDLDQISELLGRVVYLTSPMRSAIGGEIVHCLGKVEIKNDAANMIAAVSRKVKIAE